ncbi:MAG: MFS transporter [Thermodesulfobacteriota bacterium]
MRYLVLVCAVLMQMCLGATYSWSVYVQPIKELTGLLQGPVQLPFTVFYFVFPAVMITAGRWLERFGPRICAVSGGCLFGAGWILAGFGKVHFAFTVIGIGVIAGVGVGLAYIVPIATGIRWFPENKGLVTGVAVAGFGGGAALVSQIGGHLMQQVGFSPFLVLQVFGAAFGVIVSIAGLGMRNPEGSRNAVSAPPISYRNILSHPGFQVLYAAMFTGLCAGFAINANLKELGKAASFQTGVAAVSMFAMANAAGRIGWGACMDRVRTSLILRTNLLLQALTLFLSPVLLKSAFGLLVIAGVCGFNYGGVLVLYAASTARIWGAEAVGRVYGALFSANIPAALAPLLAGMLYDRTGSFLPSTVLLAILLCAAFGLTTARSALLDDHHS